VKKDRKAVILKDKVLRTNFMLKGPFRLGVRTSLFHGGDTGSNPVRDSHNKIEVAAAITVDRQPPLRGNP
jgi:hypothetical protein